LAAGKVVLEIGSYCGRSTICLAHTAKSVLAVDPFDGRGTPSPADTYQTFLDNLQRHGVAERVGVRRGTTSEVTPELPAVFDLVFVDGAHDYESVRADIQAAMAVLKPDGVLAFHDYRLPDERDGQLDPGVRRAVDELLAGGATLLSRTDSLAVVSPSPVLVPV
jgi:predicted O-methyltransferase YrrM